MSSALSPSNPAVWLLAGGLAAGLLAALRLLPGLHRVGRPLRLPATAVLVAACVLMTLWLVRPYVPGWMIRGHVFAPRTCAQAQAMGYGTARIGTPGYFAHLDADGDGWSCEPLPRRRRW